MLIPLLFLILSGCTSDRLVTVGAAFAGAAGGARGDFSTPIAMQQIQLQKQRQAQAVAYWKPAWDSLLRVQKLERDIFDQYAKQYPKDPDLAKSSANLLLRHRNEREELLRKVRAYAMNPPASAVASSPIAPLPFDSGSDGAVIMQPGQYPTYFYNYGDNGVLMQPGKMPTYVYPF